jgi:hypothetical protein
VGEYDIYVSKFRELTIISSFKINRYGFELFASCKLSDWIFEFKIPIYGTLYVQCTPILKETSGVKKTYHKGVY